MPRIPNSLLRRAKSLSKNLPLLLWPCRDLSSAANELRWLRDNAIASTNSNSVEKERGTLWQCRLRTTVQARSRGKPLQYILGSQPFGNLEMLCKKGVLIPRTETETLTTRLASLLLHPCFIQGPRSLRILDLCTGTGCISLLLHSLLAPKIPNLQILGADNSPRALALANENLRHNIALGHLKPRAITQVHFTHGDVLMEQHDSPWLHGKWDVIVSNPPYISPAAFNRTTSKSVRNFEPRSALVPPAFKNISSVENHTSDSDADNDTEVGDMFYPRILQIAAETDAKVLLFEAADMAQAERVVEMAMAMGRSWKGVEVWRDWVDEREHGEKGKREVVRIGGTDVRVIGDGNGRAVLLWREGGDGILF